MMASTEEELLALQAYRCYHCGLESTTDSFKYMNNKKMDQPRCQCEHCHKFFTLGSHGRPQGKTYAKKRNEDPAELKSLSHTCRHCGVADNAPFKYYNNRNTSQPRFKCLSCGKQFQMRVLGTGEERHLVHTSSQQKLAPHHQKKGVPEPFPNASSSSEEEIYQAFDGSFLPVLSDPLIPLELFSTLHPAISDEDVQYSEFLESELEEETTMSDEDLQYSELLETKLAEETNMEADFTSRTGNGDVGNLPPPFNTEDAQYSNYLEAELVAKENSLNVDAFSSIANVD